MSVGFPLRQRLEILPGYFVWPEDKKTPNCSNPDVYLSCAYVAAPARQILEHFVLIVTGVVGCFVFSAKLHSCLFHSIQKPFLTAGSCSVRT